MMSYTYSRTLKDGITFGIEGCHSYDEAIKIVEKGIYDYELQRKAEEKTRQYTPEGSTAGTPNKGVVGTNGVQSGGSVNAGKV